MIDNQFNHQLIDKIKEEHLRPKPRWQFLLKNYVVWTAGVFSLVLGAVAFSLIIYLWQANVSGMPPRLFSDFGEFITVAIPVFWLICLALFIWLIYYNLKKTDHGYRYSAPLIVFCSILVSLSLGIVFYGAGLGQTFDDVMWKRLPKYYRVINPHMEFWYKPEKGRLTGLVTAKRDDGLIVVSIDRKEWLVDISQASLPRQLIIEVGLPIRCTGSLTGLSTFMAKEIMPVSSGREFIKNFPKPNRDNQPSNNQPPTTNSAPAGTVCPLFDNSGSCQAN